MALSVTTQTKAICFLYGSAFRDPIAKVSLRIPVQFVRPGHYCVTFYHSIKGGSYLYVHG